MLYLTCQSPDCEPVASSHILERWVHPNWRRFSGGWSQASERHKVPLERKVGTFLLRGGASAEVKSGRAEVLRSTETNLCIDWSNCAAALQRYLCVCVRAQAFYRRHHYLLDVSVQLEYLSLPFHLPDADLTGELRHSQAASLQAEGAMQGSLTATPNVIKRYLLSHRQKR